MPESVKETANAVRLHFLRSTTFQFRQYAAGERPVQWFSPRDANRLIKAKIAEVDETAPTWEAALESEDTPEPPPQTAGNPHGSVFDKRDDATTRTEASEADT